MEGMTRRDTSDGSSDEIARPAVRDPGNPRRHGLDMYFDDDGMFVIEGWLSPEVTAVLNRALDAAEEELLRWERSEGDGATSSSTESLSPREARRDAERLRADAFQLVVERSLEAGV